MLMLALIHAFSTMRAMVTPSWCRTGFLGRLPDQAHFIPALPALEPMNGVASCQHATHDTMLATCTNSPTDPRFLRETVPRNWADLCDSVAGRVFAGCLYRKSDFGIMVMKQLLMD